MWQVLRPDGRHVRFVGESSPGLLKNPVGVAVDGYGAPPPISIYIYIYIYIHIYI